MSDMATLAAYCEATHRADGLRDRLFGYDELLGGIPRVNPIRFCSKSEFDKIVVTSYAEPYRGEDGKTKCADVLGVTFCTLLDEDGQ